LQFDQQNPHLFNIESAPNVDHAKMRSESNQSSGLNVSISDARHTSKVRQVAVSIS
jgi:hypothetical protein